RHAFVDPAGQLVDAGSEKRQAGGVVARRLRGGRADGETLAFVEVRGDRRVGGGVIDRSPPLPGVIEPQAEAQQEDCDQSSEASSTPVSRRRPAHHPADAMGREDGVFEPRDGLSRPHRCGRLSLPPPMRILILGGDGYLGWPTALRFSARGHEVSVVDNFSRRRWHTEHGTASLTPILDLESRIEAWRELSGEEVRSYVGSVE